MPKKIIPPVILSYFTPFALSNHHSGGFSNVPLSAVNYVEMPSSSPEYHDALSHWRTADHHLLARMHATLLIGASIRSMPEAVTSLVDGDGTCIDEFGDLDNLPDCITGFLNLERLFSEKVWAALVSRPSQFPGSERGIDALQALKDKASIVMPEMYLYEQDEHGNPHDILKSDDEIKNDFKSLLLDWERVAPKIINKVVIGLNLEQRPGSGQGASPEFVGRQIRICSSDPFLKRAIGIALYRPSFMSDVQLAILNRSLLEYSDSIGRVKETGKIVQAHSYEGHFNFTLDTGAGWRYRITQASRPSDKEAQFPAAVPLLCAALATGRKVQVSAIRSPDEPDIMDVEQVNL